MLEQIGLDDPEGRVILNRGVYPRKVIVLPSRSAMEPF
jgi:hypothetical protein